MLQDTLNVVRDTVIVAQDSGFDPIDFVKYVVGAVGLAIVAYFSSKKGAKKGVTGS